MGEYRTGLFTRLISKRTTFGWIFLILVAILGNGKILHFFCGLPFVLFGEYIRILSAGIIKKNEVLAKEGTYALCRHPLYFGSFLISFGLTIMSNNLFIYAYFAIFFPLFYIPTILKEEKFLKSKFGNEFENYRRNVPVFFPKLKPFGFKNFSFHQFKKNKEHVNCLMIGILIIILLIKSCNKF